MPARGCRQHLGWAQQGGIACAETVIDFCEPTRSVRGRRCAFFLVDRCRAIRALTMRSMSRASCTLVLTDTSASWRILVLTSIRYPFRLVILVLWLVQKLTFNATFLIVVLYTCTQRLFFCFFFFMDLSSLLFGDKKSTCRFQLWKRQVLYCSLFCFFCLPTGFSGFCA